jgi:CHAT domain-containing protein
VDARGAGNGGNGGFVEISGKERLAFDGKVDLAGPLGKAGQVLFDPLNINIVAGFGADDNQVLIDRQIFAADVGNPDFNIGANTLAGINGDITLQASQDINLNTPLIFGPQLGRNIGFTAGRDFNGGNQNITALGQNVAISGVNLSINSIDTSGIVAAGSTSAAGNINLNAQGNITIGSTPILDVASGKTFLVSLRALSSNNIGSAGKGGNISLFSGNGNVTSSGLIQSFSLSQGLASPGGDVTINALQGGVFTGPIYTFSESRNNTSASGGKVEIIARGDIAIALDTDPQNAANSINTLSQATGGSAGKGGEISLKSDSGNITAGEIQAQSQVCFIANICSTAHGARENGLSSSDGGNVTLTSLGNIKIRGVSSISESFQGDTGKGGNVALTSQNGAVDVQNNIQTVSRADGTKAGAGGSVEITSQGSIKIGEVGTLSGSWGNTSQSGEGGAVNLKSDNGSIAINKVTSESYVNLDGEAKSGGGISLIAKGDIKVDGQFNAFSNRTEALISKSKVGGNGASISGRGGTISLIANNGAIEVVGDVDSSSKIDSVGNSNNGGNITFESFKGITVETLNSSSQIVNAKNISTASGTSGSGGNISLIGGGNVRVGILNSSSASKNKNAGAGGSVALKSVNGNIDVGSVASQSQTCASVCLPGDDNHKTSLNVASSGDGGNINLDASGGIKTAQINSFSESFIGGAGKGGNITLASRNGRIDTGKVLAFSLADGSKSSDGGAVSIKSAGGIIAGPVFTTSASWADASQAAGLISILSDSGDVNTGDLYAISLSKSVAGNPIGLASGKGGQISLGATKGNIDAGIIQSQAQVCLQADCGPEGGHSSRSKGLSSDDGGDIILTASGNIKAVDINSFSESFQGNTGKGGDVKLTSTTGSVTAQSITTASRSDGIKAGNGGSITVKSQGLIKTGRLETRSASWGPSSQSGNGGAVDFQSSSGSIEISGVSSEAFVNLDGTTGSGGNIFLTANSGAITTKDLGSWSEVRLNGTTGNGGQIILNGGAIKTNILDSSSQVGGNGVAGAGGSVTLTSKNDKVEVGAVTAFSQVVGPGTASAGGNIIVDGQMSVKTGELSTFSSACNDSSCPSIATSFSGDGGLIRINSQGNITTDGLLTWSSAPKSAGNAGAISLESSKSNINLAFTDAYSGSPAGASKDGGEVKLTATQGSVSVAQKINSFSNGANSSGNGGDIVVNAGGNISAPEGLFSFSQFSSNPSTMRRGGNITLDSTGGGIQVGTIESFADGRSTAPIKGGDVTLTAKSNIATKEIYAGAQGSNGQGGKVTITTEGLFQSSGIREGNVFCSGTSICTAGGAGVGAIKIFHGGELKGIPFTVGKLTKNGTLGAIQTQIEDIGLDGQVWSFKGGYRSPKGSIQINTVLPIFPSPPSPLPQCFSNPKECDDRDPDSPSQDLDSPDENQIPQQSPSLENIQEALKQVESATTIKPALIYVSFHLKARLDETQSSSEKSVRVSEDELFSRKSQSRVLKLLLNEYEKHEWQLKIIVVSSEGDPIRRLVDVDPKTIMNQARLFREYIKTPSNEGEKEEHKAPAKILYDRLIAPIRSELEDKKIKNLVFVMQPNLSRLKVKGELYSPELSAIPLAALYDGHDYIVRNYSVGIMPNVRIKDTRYSDLAQGKILASGTNQFLPVKGESDNPRGLRLSSTLLNFVETISKNSKLGEDKFTSKDLREKQRETKSDNLLLVTHGKAYPGDPKSSYIRFRQEKLSFKEFRELKLGNPSLLVLGACDTATGNGLGFAGRAYRFGVQSVLASLWDVNELSTLGVLSRFYANLDDSKREFRPSIKAELLRKSQLAMFEGSTKVKKGYLDLGGLNREIPLPNNGQNYDELDLSHPHYWAGFTLVGNPW